MRKTVRKDIVDKLRWIQEEGQCDCHICDTAGEAAAEIERLRAAGNYLYNMVAGGYHGTHAVALQRWKDAFNGVESSG